MEEQYLRQDHTMQFDFPDKLLERDNRTIALQESVKHIGNMLSALGVSYESNFTNMLTSWQKEVLDLAREFEAYLKGDDGGLKGGKEIE